MKTKTALLVSIALGLGTSGALFANKKEKEKWVCHKEEAEVKVKGKTSGDKAKDCEKQGGTWEKVESAQQSSGDAGAW